MHKPSLAAITPNLEADAYGAPTHIYKSLTWLLTRCNNYVTLYHVNELIGVYMPTKNQRVNMTLDSQTAVMLNYLAKKDPSGSVSCVAKQLILEALELREDLYLSKLAESRENQKKISHENAWK